MEGPPYGRGRSQHSAYRRLEILFTDDVPDKVAIDEALALAKTLCDDDSPAFIHGLLSAVCTAKNAAPAPESVAEEADEESSDSAAAASGADR